MPREKIMKELAIMQLTEMVFEIVLKISNQSELKISRENVEDAVREVYEN